MWLRADPASFFGQPAPPFFLSPLYIYVLALPQDRRRVARGRAVRPGAARHRRRGARDHRAAVVRRRRGLVDGGPRGLFGLSTFYEILILPAALDPFLTALDLYLLARAIDRRTWPAWAIAGAALGLHALNRPNTLVVFGGLTAALVVWALARRNSEPYRRSGRDSYAQASSSSPRRHGAIGA